MRLIKLEIKRMLRTKSTCIIIILAIILSGMIGLSSALVERSTILNSDGVIEHISGIKAINYKREIEKPLEGLVLPDIFVDVINKYQKVYMEHGGDIPNEVFVQQVSPITEILYLMPYIFQDSDGSVSARIFYELQPQEAATFYDKRAQQQGMYWEYKLEDNNAGLRQVEEREDFVKKPFYFSSYSGWDTAGEYMGICIGLIVLLCGVIAAPVFSGEYANEADDILRTTKYGRRHLAVAKLVSTMGLLGMLYIVCMVIYGGICYSIFGAKGLKTSVQFINLLSPSPYTIGELYVRTIFIGFLITMAMVMFTLFLSTKFQTSIIVMALSIGMLIVPSFLQAVANKKDSFSSIRYILPSSGLGVYNELLQVNYVRIGTWSIWSPYVIGIALVMYIFIFFTASIRAYCRHEVMH
ncbi:ABC-2 family transporter [Natranaerovirga hydrolytica]|uniref:ABC-2 family transporter n=1 Tax=Natranaerovirga hydrolytica TaxID=680378 RepID=A0A4V2Q1S1_9FIRM|nr:ABC transporter permease subunit [Natranaerovirga hydrolytica]TCK98731.1 ABC-2 family transporter [Natranaerovirga hydrolytica]